MAAPDARSDATKPSFDVVRVEPTGESVIAARGAPDTDVVLLDGDKVAARAKTDANGQVAFVPPALTPGDHNLMLSMKTPTTGETVSSQSVVVSVPAHGGTAPLVAMIQPNQPAAILSGPVAGDIGTGGTGTGTEAVGDRAVSVGKSTTGTPVAVGTAPMAIRSVEIEDMGSFYASGKATPGRPCRIYLNGSFVATVTPDGNGIWSLQIKRGMKPGRYAVRVDEVEAGSGKVIARAEVPFEYPRAVGASLRKGQSASRKSIAGVRAGTAVPTAAMTSADGLSSPNRSQPTAVPFGSDAMLPGEGPVFGSTRIASTNGAPAATPTPTPMPTSTPSGAVTAGAPSSSIIADLLTAKVFHGDSLWRISRKMLGHGIRYTQIYAANTAQIRDPKLIYPGQVFVMPQTERP